MKSIILITASLGLLGPLFATPAGAQSDYPTRPVRVLIGGPPASSADISGRLLTTKLSERLGQPIIVENKPGGSGAVAALEVARAEPDGHTLLITAS